MKWIEQKKETITESVARMGIIYRQCRRLYKRYRREGDKGAL
jgi:hypothetical protein